MSHRRRGVGVGRSGAAGKKQFAKKADEIKATSLQSALDTMEKLRVKLKDFAKHHQAEIQDDPAFRQQFLVPVKIAEICFATRSKNGGIIAVSEIQEILSRNKKKQVHKGDIPIAVNKLKSLGGGFRIIEIGKTSMIVSVPTELDSDHVQVFSLAESGEGCITTDDISTQLGWNHNRAERVMKLLLSEGMAWEDKYHGVSFYWFPSVWKEQRQAEILS
ncbi:MAG: hypothetical protein SGBAC_012651 [Bacillariaceae sp.]